MYKFKLASLALPAFLLLAGCQMTIPFVGNRPATGILNADGPTVIVPPAIDRPVQRFKPRPGMLRVAPTIGKIHLCPIVVTYSKFFQARLKKELEQKKIDKTTYTGRLLTDYKNLIKDARTCKRGI